MARLRQSIVPTAAWDSAKPNTRSSMPGRLWSYHFTVHSLFLKSANPPAAFAKVPGSRGFIPESLTTRRRRPVSALPASSARVPVTSTKTVTVDTRVPEGCRSRWRSVQSREMPRHRSCLAPRLSTGMNPRQPDKAGAPLGCKPDTGGAGRERITESIALSDHPLNYPANANHP